MFKFLSLKGKVLFITSCYMNYKTLGLLRKALKPFGVLGVMAMHDEAEVDVKTLDQAIKYLQELKEKQNGKEQTA